MPFSGCSVLLPASRRLNAFPPEEASVHGPQTRAKHGKRGSDCRYEEVQQSVCGYDNNPAALKQGHKRTDDRRIQADYEKHCCYPEEY